MFLKDLIKIYLPLVFTAEFALYHIIIGSLTWRLTELVI
jgi:hypothetical protein